MAEALVINLEDRPERWQAAQRVLGPLVAGLTRFDGVRSPIPHQGCGLAHANAVEWGVSVGRKLLLVFEDDAVPMGRDTTASALEVLLREAEAHAHEFHAINMGVFAWPQLHDDAFDGYLRPSSSPMFWEMVPSRCMANANAMVYSHTILPLMRRYRQFCEAGSVVPVDRIWAGAYGPFAFSGVRIWVPRLDSVYFGQADGFSDNMHCHLRFGRMFTRSMHMLARASSLAESADVARPLPPPDAAPEAEMTCRVSVVTAFFPIKSKQPPSFYLQHARRLLSNVPAHVVVFTAPEFAAAMRDMRGAKPMTVIEMSDAPEECSGVRSWLTEEQWSRASEWASAAGYWPTGISAELLRLWLCKPWFVSEAIRRDSDCGASEFVAWCDIGCIRHDDFAKRLREWPSLKLLRALKAAGGDRVYLSQRRSVPVPCPRDLRDVHADSIIGASVIMAPRVAWSGVLDDLKVAASVGFRDRRSVFDETLLLLLATETAPHKYCLVPWGKRAGALFASHHDPSIRFEASWHGGALIPNDSDLSVRSVWPPSLPLPSSNRCKNFQAMYGVPGAEVDVSAHLHERLSLRPSPTGLPVTNETMGRDPAYGLLKRLRITFEFEGVYFECEDVKEGDVLRLVTEPSVVDAESAM